MTPILYESTEREFTTNGIGRLSDAEQCTVTEERNGEYELYMRYPTNGIHYADLALDRLIYARPAEGKNPQAFRIYKITKPRNGIVSVYAEHISYLLNKIIVEPFTAGSCAEAMLGLENHAIGTMEFTTWTDKTGNASFTVDEPQSIKACLAGRDGSILDVYGTGEYEFDMFTVKLHLHRGTDSGVTLRYGKNIKDITADADMTETYTAIIPFWKNNDVTMMLPEKIVYASTQYANSMAKAVDFSSEWQDQPTESQLRAKAETYLANNKGWEINQNITVDFVQLWQTKEYESYASLQRVNLCDTVSVIYDPLGVTATAKVVKTVFNVLLDRYDSIEIGDAAATLTGAVAEVAGEETKNLPTKSFLQKSIERATKLITGGLGGYIVWTYNADGEPEEMLILDTPDVSTAVNVWRWNKNGLGFSSTGYDGEYRLAMTIDGHIVADFIDTGYLTANIIKSGILQALSNWVKFNLDTGVLELVRAKFYNGSTANPHFVSCDIGGTGIRFYEPMQSGEKLNYSISAAGVEISEQNNGQYSIVRKYIDSGTTKYGASLSWGTDGKIYNYGGMNVSIYNDETVRIAFRAAPGSSAGDFVITIDEDGIDAGGCTVKNLIIDGGITGNFWVLNSNGQPAKLSYTNGALTGTQGF